MNNIHMPLVSVIIPCYNQGQFLYEAIASVYNAYMGKLEIIIIDDGSEDSKIRKYFREIEHDFSEVKIIHQKNRGLSAARNAGIDIAKGEFIQFLDADDILLYKKIDYQIDHFKISNNIDVSVSQYVLSDENLNAFWLDGDSINKFDLNLDDFLYCWERGLSIPIHCALFSKKIFENIRFNDEIKAKEDWVFWSTLAFNKMKISALPLKNGVLYRQHKNSMRKSLLNMAKKWVNATMYIDSFVNKIRPDFFENSICWLNSFYRQQPSYKEEIVNTNDEKHTMNSPLKIEIGSINFDGLIEKMNKTNKKPFISIVIPVYNHFEYLQYCFDSVANQSYDKYEIIIIDDNSKDFRVKESLIKLYGKSENITVIMHEENQGIIISLNEGVKIARGEYIALLDCDDAIKQNALSEIERAISKNKDNDYIFTDRYDIDINNKVIRKAVYGGYDFIKPSDNIKWNLLDGMVASHLKVICKEKYLRFSQENSKFDGIQDWELALNFCDDGAGFVYIPQGLYEHRIHENSVTSADHVSQMRKTNQLRRIFQIKWYGNAKKESVQVFNIEKLNLEEIKKVWSECSRCEVVVSADSTIEKINLIREYNSYFEKIVCESASCYYALLGYMWDWKVLVLREQKE